MMNTTFSRILIVGLASGLTLSGQGGFLGKTGKTLEDGLGSKTPSTPPALATSGDFVRRLTLATDQGMRALDELAAVFPPEKVAAFRQLSSQYQEAAKTRKDSNIDAASLTLAGDAADEMAKLEGEWQSYRKEGAQGVRRAHARIGLMLIVDGSAGAQAPKFASDLRTELQRSGTKMLKNAALRDQMLARIRFLDTVGEQAPRQTRAFTTVRRIARNIAEAERFKLADDPAPDSVTTTPQLTLAFTKIDADIPAQKQ
jgi:hypothetical protein